MRAILSRTTTDIIKSKILSPNISQIVLDVYVTPMEFAEIITKYDSKEFKIDIKPIK